MSADFFIIGAPKSGTSSLFYWLNSHPDLQGSVPKETFFFMDAEHPLCGRHGVSYHKDGLPAYERFFSTTKGKRLLFEGTTHYFYQSIARNVLTSGKKQPIIIILLREPASRVLSSFRFTRDNLSNCDRLLTFDHYVSCIVDDKTRDLDKFYHSDGSLYIAKRQLELNRYVVWLDFWLERLRRERLEILLFEELKASPRAVVDRLCERIGIDGSVYDEFDFDARNPTVPVGRQSIHRVARRLGAGVPGGALKRWAKSRYLTWQGRAASPDRDYRQGIESLRDYFAPWNQRLAREYGLDLARWWGDASGGGATSVGGEGIGLR